METYAFVPRERSSRISIRHSLPSRQARPPRRPTGRPGRGPLLESLEERVLFQTTWYVATTGSNASRGTLSKPVQTIQKAANVAKPGDTVAGPTTSR